MAFNRSHGFIINGNVKAVDNSRSLGGSTNLEKLLNAACPGAGHDSAERADPPKCHPDTRKEVIGRIMRWVDGQNGDAVISWLNGSAGIGKSAIAQTIADMCHSKGKLLSSFFFSRTSPGSERSEGSRLIPTIAYHLAIAVPEAKELILDEMERDPAIFTKAMEVQLRHLVIPPILSLKTAGMLVVPPLIIIDGLDECGDVHVQARLIKAIADVAADHFRFLITSRPEREIQKAFDLYSVAKVSSHMSLNDPMEFRRYEDIEIYLRGEFERITNSHILSGLLSSDPQWATDSDIQTLVRRSEGHFIYASTVIKFIENDRRDPRESLRIIINQSGSPDLPSFENPYMTLDLLYKHVISAALERANQQYPAFSKIFQVLVFKFQSKFLLSPELLMDLSGLTRAELILILTDLHSIIHVPDLQVVGTAKVRENIGGETYFNRSVRFHHSTFPEFLLDASRSGPYFLDLIQGHVALARRCFSILFDMTIPGTALTRPRTFSKNSHDLKVDVKDSFLEPKVNGQKYALDYYFFHMKGSNFNAGLIEQFPIDAHIYFESIFIILQG